MSIYIGNDLEDGLEALEAENASLRKYNDYHLMVVHEINHMSDLHVDSSFYKQSMKLDNYFKINKWIDSSIGQSTVLRCGENVMMSVHLHSSDKVVPTHSPKLVHNLSY